MKVTNAELNVQTVDGRTFTIPQAELQEIDIKERVQNYKDTGSITVASTPVSKYTQGPKLIRAGDEAVFRTQLEGEDALTERWRGLLTPETYNQQSPTRVNIDFSVTDFVFGILSMRHIYDEFENRAVSGGSRPLLQELINRKAPAIEKGLIEPVGVTVDRFCQGTNLLELVIELAQRSDAFLGQRGRSIVFKPLDGISTSFSVQSDDVGLPTVNFSSADLTNRVRVKGGTSSKLEEDTTPQQYWFRVTEGTRKLYQLRMRKATIDKIQVWTELTTQLKDITDLQWTASGSGTNEYYVEADGGGDPGLASPYNTYEDSVSMTPGTAGSLAAGEWDWADNDSLGFQTVYVRLSDGADPNSKDRDTIMIDQNNTTPSSDSIRIRIQSNEGGAPAAITDPDSDIVKKVVNIADLQDAGLTTFTLPDHKLPDPDPWLIIEADGVDGQLLGLNSGSEPVIKSYFQYHLSSVQQDRESAEKYRVRSSNYYRDNLRTSSEVNQLIQAKLGRNAEPDKELTLPARSKRAHQLRTGQAVTIQFDKLGVAADYILTQKDTVYGGPRLETTLKFQRADTV